MLVWHGITFQIELLAGDPVDITLRWAIVAYEVVFFFCKKNTHIQIFNHASWEIEGLYCLMPFLFHFSFFFLAHFGALFLVLGLPGRFVAVVVAVFFFNAVRCVGHDYHFAQANLNNK